MGACLSRSTPAGEAKAFKALPSGLSATTAAQEADTSIREPSKLSSQPSAQQGYALLQAMAMLSPHPLLALPEAAELILDHTRCDVVAISAFADADPACAVLLAASGAGAAALEADMLMRGSDWSARRAADATDGRLSVRDAHGESQLPLDVLRLAREAGIRSAEVLAIGPPGNKPLGALLVGRAQPGGFDGDDGALACLNAAATGLLQLLRQGCVVCAANMLQPVCESADPVSAIGALLQGAAHFMWRATNLTIAVRLALFVGGSGYDRRDALLFESVVAAPPRRRHDSVSSSGGRSGIVLDPAAGVTVRQLQLEGTLLARSFALRQAYVVKDAAMYMQSCASPARDLLSAVSSVATSLAVVPMYWREEPYGALYFAPSSPIDFGNVQDTLLAIVPGITLALASKLQGKMAQLQGLVTQARTSLELWQSMSAPLPVIPGGSPPSSPPAAAPAKAGPSAAAPPTGEAALGPRGAALKRMRSGWDDAAEAPARGADGAGALPGAGGGVVLVGGAGGDNPHGQCGGGGGGAGDANTGTDGEANGTAAPDSVLPLIPPPRAGAAAAGGAHASPGSPALGVAGAAGGEAGGQVLLIADQRQCVTESMVMVLQDEIRRSRASCSLELSFMSDLTLVREIGRGGFGTVYSGFWRKTPAAIKVMHARHDDGEAVSDAMEIAVLSSVQHPNIVQLYSCLLGMVVAEEDNTLVSASFCCPDAQEAQPPPRFRRTRPGEARGGPQTYNLIVMELCDRGSLRDAVRQGLLHKQRSPQSPLVVDADSVVEVLLDVATSLQYLHSSANLVHGDVKLDNVLLKSNPCHALGFVPKLSDFGLTKVLSPDAGKHIINLTGAGTVTHLAPELLIPGSTITPAVDVYAFGIMMFELFTATQPYAGLSREAIIAAVLHRDTRPAFPPGTPPAFAALAARCWHHDAAARPDFGEVVLALRVMRGRQPPQLPPRVPPAGPPAAGACDGTAAGAAGAAGAQAAPGSPQPAAT